jgi:hypothetical protein
MKETISTENQIDADVTEYELVSVIVEYDDRPDQCTIYHPESNGIERMSNWISANTECCIDLHAMR